MIETSSARIVIFGKLAGFALILLGVAALIAAGSFLVSVANESQDSQKQIQAPTSQDHDFQLVQLGTFRRDQFLFDKRSGRVWQSMCFGDAAGPDCKGMLIWKEMYVGGVTPRDVSVTQDYLQQKYLQEVHGGK